jgi:hypothetical protein
MTASAPQASQISFFSCKDRSFKLPDPAGASFVLPLLTDNITSCFVFHEL